MSDEQKTTNLDTMCVTRSMEASLDFPESNQSREKRQKIANEAAGNMEFSGENVQANLIQRLMSQVEFLASKVEFLESAIVKLVAAQASNSANQQKQSASFEVEFLPKDFPAMGSNNSGKSKRSKTASSASPPSSVPQQALPAATQPSAVPSQAGKQSYAEAAKKNAAFRKGLQDVQSSAEFQKAALRPPVDPREHRFPEGQDSLRASGYIVLTMAGPLKREAQESRANQIAVWKACLGLLNPHLRDAAIIYPFDRGQRAEVFVSSQIALKEILDKLATANLALLDSPGSPEHKAAPAFIARRARSYAFARCRAERHMLLFGLGLPLQEAILHKTLTSRSDTPPLLQKYAASDLRLCQDQSTLA